MISKLVLTSAIAFILAGGTTQLAAADVKTGDAISQQVTDARREAQIWTSYAMNPHLRAFDISVKVDGNKAMLDGKVESDIEKDLAEQIALGVEGIKHVDNRLAVEANYVPAKRSDSDSSFGEKVEDATITATVKSKLLWDSHTDGLDIHVETNHGKVTLTGTANSGIEKDLAGRIANNTSGVVGVNNQIAVTGAATSSNTVANNKPANAHIRNTAKGDERPVSDAWISTKVKSTLLFSRNVSGTAISVTTNNGIVSLSGTVSTPAERELAVELAQNVRGVRKVDASGLHTG